MAEFQLIACEINLGGDRDNTVVRDRFDPVTFPEYLVLQAIHGGADHVHSPVAVGYREIDVTAERERLSQVYGASLVAGLFPGAMAMLPLSDASIPSIEEVEAGAAAAKEARAKVRTNTKIGKPKEPDKPEKQEAPKPLIPDLTT